MRNWIEHLKFWSNFYRIFLVYYLALIYSGSFQIIYKSSTNRHDIYLQKYIWINNVLNISITQSNGIETSPYNLKKTRLIMLTFHLTGQNNVLVVIFSRHILEWFLCNWSKGNKHLIKNSKYLFNIHSCFNNMTR